MSFLKTSKKHPQTTTTSTTSMSLVDKMKMACEKGDTQMVRQLITLDPPSCSWKLTTGEWTPLHYVGYFGHEEITSLLLTAKADINAKDKYGQTPLHVASHNGHDKIVSMLLSADANIWAKTDDGRSALDVARTPKIKDLLKRKADQIWMQEEKERKQKEEREREKRKQEEEQKRREAQEKEEQERRKREEEEKKKKEILLTEKDLKILELTFQSEELQSKLGKIEKESSQFFQIIQQIQKKPKKCPSTESHAHVELEMDHKYLSLELYHNICDISGSGKGNFDLKYDFLTGAFVVPREKLEILVKSELFSSGYQFRECLCEEFEEMKKEKERKQAFTSFQWGFIVCACLNACLWVYLWKYFC